MKILSKVKFDNRKKFIEIQDIKTLSTKDYTLDYCKTEGNFFKEKTKPKHTTPEANKNIEIKNNKILKTSNDKVIKILS
jgi:hypothetical protein